MELSWQQIYWQLIKKACFLVGLPNQGLITEPSHLLGSSQNKGHSGKLQKRTMQCPHSYRYCSLSPFFSHDIFVAYSGAREFDYILCCWAIKFSVSEASWSQKYTQKVSAVIKRFDAGMSLFRQCLVIDRHSGYMIIWLVGFNSLTCRNHMTSGI